LAYTATQIDGIFKVIGGALSYITKLLTPVFIGIVIAYILDPLVAVFEKLYKRVKFLKFRKNEKYRSLSVFSCILVILFVIFLLVGIFIFSITKQISGINMEEFIKVTTNYINSFSESLKGIEGNLATFNIESNALEQYIVQISTILMTTLSNFANNLTTNALNISGYVSNFIFGLIIAIYLLLDKKEFVKYGDIFSRALFSDKVQQKIKSYWHDFDNIFSGYIRGQLLDALFMSVVLSISLSIIGIKFGALIGVLAGLCNLIPYFGPIVAFVGTVFFGVLNAQYSRVVIAIVTLLIVQQIDGTIVGPKLLGNSVSLKPVFILIAVIVGAGIGGVAGMVLAVPVAALIKLFIKRFIEERLKEKELKKENSIDIG
jgi:predicted PurR-regulated permease PerM